MLTDRPTACLPPQVPTAAAPRGAARAAIYLVDRRDMDGAVVAMGSLGPRLRDPDVLPLEVLNKRLNSFGGLLFDQARMRRGYGLWAGFPGHAPSRDPTSLSLSLSSPLPLPLCLSAPLRLCPPCLLCFSASQPLPPLSLPLYPCLSAPSAPLLLPPLPLPLYHCLCPSAPCATTPAPSAPFAPSAPVSGTRPPAVRPGPRSEAETGWPTRCPDPSSRGWMPQGLLRSGGILATQQSSFLVSRAAEWTRAQRLPG